MAGGRCLSYGSTSTSTALRCPHTRSPGPPRDVDPRVDVRRRVVIPREGRALELPDVPDPVVADVAFLVEGEPELVGPSRVAQALLDRQVVHGPERPREVAEE